MLFSMYFILAICFCNSVLAQYIGSQLLTHSYICLLLTYSMRLTICNIEGPFDC